MGIELTRMQKEVHKNFPIFDGNSQNFCLAAQLLFNNAYLPGRENFNSGNVVANQGCMLDRPIAYLICTAIELLFKAIFCYSPSYPKGEYANITDLTHNLVTLKEEADERIKQDLDEKLDEDYQSLMEKGTKILEWSAKYPYPKKPKEQLENAWKDDVLNIEEIFPQIQLSDIKNFFNFYKQYSVYKEKLWNLKIENNRESKTSK